MWTPALGRLEKKMKKKILLFICLITFLSNCIFAELKKGEDSAAKNGWLDPSDVRKMAGL